MHPPRSTSPEPLVPSIPGVLGFLITFPRAQASRRAVCHPGRIDHPATYYYTTVVGLRALLIASTRCRHNEDLRCRSCFCCQRNRHACERFPAAARRRPWVMAAGEAPSLVARPSPHTENGKSRQVVLNQVVLNQVVPYPHSHQVVDWTWNEATEMREFHCPSWVMLVLSPLCCFAATDHIEAVASFRYCLALSLKTGDL